MEDEGDTVLLEGDGLVATVELSCELAIDTVRDREIDCEKENDGL